MRSHRMLVSGLALLAVMTGVAPASASARSPGEPAARPAASAPVPTALVPAAPVPVYRHLSLPNGGWAQVYSDGIAAVRQPGGGYEVRHVPLALLNGAGRGALMADLAQGAPQPYAAHEVIAIYRPAMASPRRLLAQLGVDRTEPLFTGAARIRLEGMRAAAQQRAGHALLDFPNAVLLHVAGASVAEAIARLRADPGVAFAEPDWSVTTANTPPVPVSAPAVTAAVAAASAQAAGVTAPEVPSNYTLASSAQSLLNTPGVNAVPAFAELAKRYGQLPGQGEIITNVSLGMLADASAGTNPHDPCNASVQESGPTTVIRDGQRYLDMPSMPLIPAYTSSTTGGLDPAGEACGFADDPQLGEVGLDFSMMAPLPHQFQRPGETGSGLTDLLGIAPGARYRLVVPSAPNPATSDIATAFLAAATQTPKPDVITASLGFGFDQFGFSGRYLEDDPMMESVIASIVGRGIVVCVSAGDGLRLYTNAATSPAGGAVATNVASAHSQVTNLSDVEMSDVPSRDLDSGAIDVGGTTLDDISAAPPGNPAFAALSYIHAFPATRYDGSRLYASGFGSRVDIAAPGDNVLSLQHNLGGAADAVQVVNEGGTSASAPEVAAAAAVVLQVARLTGDTRLAGDPLAVRAFLASTGTPVPSVPEADTAIQVGPQVNVGRAVETLLARAGRPAQPGVARVAVEQRQQVSALDGTIQTATDPRKIDLTGRLADAWITIAPDWTGLGSQRVRYRLTGPRGQLAATPWARLRPATILAAAGLPLISAGTRTVPVTYQAIRNGHVVAQVGLTLTFGPCDGKVPSVRAPVVSPVVRGSSIRVRYNLAGLTGATKPVLVVSEPGRVDPETGLFFRPAYTTPLAATSGTVDVPVSALRGAGVYGIGIQDSPGGSAARTDSAFAVTRVASSGDGRPDPPTLSAQGTPPGHFLAIADHGSFQLSYDVRGVPGANGAVAEFSAPGPNTWGSYATFDNPAGSRRDANGHDSGSVAYIPLPGTRGTVTLDSGRLGLDPTMYYTVRVLATAGGRVAGEASGVSSLEVNGIAPADGGGVNFGFGINPRGNDGLLTSTGGSVETFRQDSDQTKTIASSSSDQYSTIGLSSAGIFSGDVGVYDDHQPATSTDNYHVVNPVAAGAVRGTWKPPAALGPVDSAAPVSAPAQGVILSDNGPLVTATNFVTGTFGTPISLHAAFSRLTAPGAAGFAVNPVTDQAVTMVVNTFSSDTPSTLIVADLRTRRVTSVTGPSDGFFGVAVNPVSGTALEGLGTGFAVVNLATHAIKAVYPGGDFYQSPQAIPGTGDYLIEEFGSPDSLDAGSNNNTMSSVLVIDSAGKVLHRYEQFNFLNTFLVGTVGDYLQVNASTSTAFALGPLGAQLYPFRY